MLFCAIACWMGPASDYDVRNYHLYDAHALLTGRLSLDLVPAQLQTFHPPALDSVIEALRRKLNTRPAVFLSLLALPYAGCAWLAWRMAVAMVTEPSGGRHTLACQTIALCAALAGATGAAALPTLAGPMSEAPVDCFLLLACRLCWQAPSGRRLFAAGLCLGAAVGLKLTAGCACAGIGLAWLMTDRAPGRPRRLAWLVCGALIGAAATGGWWWWFLWHRTGNPLFPYFNQLFASPWLPPVSLADRRFLPRSSLQALFDPFWWAVRPSRVASELPVRDPRLAVVEALVIILLAAGCAAPRLRHRLLDRRAVFLIIVCTVTYASWAFQFGILRYLAVLEFLAAPVMMIPLRGLGRRGLVATACAAPLLFGLLIGVTIYPHWGRAARRDVVATVRLPRMPHDSLLILLDPAPMAYVALDAPADVALVGANNNLVHPGDMSGLARQVEQRIRDHAGPLFGLEMPSEAGDMAATTLRYYRLHRLPGCVPVASSLDNDGITLCALARDG